MIDPTLRIVTRRCGANAALVDGLVRPDAVALNFEHVPVLVHAFRRMVRERAYDISEMALTTYLCAREHGVPITALPIFLVRGLHHGAIVHNPVAGVRGPSDLAGRAVGVRRGYTVTTGVWARAILQEEHGVDPHSVTWVRDGDEHVESYRPPANVVDADGPDVGALVAAGALPAAVNVDPDGVDVVPLIPDATAAGLEALTARGFYPINHLVVVRDDVLAALPQLGTDLFTAFAEAKTRYLSRLTADPDPGDTAEDRLLRQVMRATGADPLPYGIDPNRAVLEGLVGHAQDQDIIRGPVDVDDLFVPSTRRMVA